jgi:mono/diheme cytochrome c family protein
MRRARPLVPAALLTLALVVGGCGDSDDDNDDAGGTPDERAASVAALIESGEFAGDGADLYRRSCASCHGGDGQGGIGPQLAGSVTDKYTPEEHAGVVLAGRGTMPAFGSTLSEDEIAAIVAYERTELGEG